MKARQGLQRGFGAIAAIVVLVILAALAAAITTLSTAQQLGSAQDVMATRALWAAHAGTEWGLYRALKSADCDTQSWPYPDDAGLTVTVSCEKSDYKDGETTPDIAHQLRVFTVTATACTATACPAIDPSRVASAGYVERQRVAVAYCEWDNDNNACKPESEPEPEPD